MAGPAGPPTTALSHLTDYISGNEEEIILNIQIYSKSTHLAVHEPIYIFDYSKGNYEGLNEFKVIQILPSAINQTMLCLSGILLICST